MCSMKCCRLYDKAKIARKTILVSRVCNVKLCKWSCANAVCRDAPFFACWQQAKVSLALVYSTFNLTSEKAAEAN